MEQLIHIINNLQATFAATNLAFNVDLPQIVVVGCQSAGKSSVLENFIGKDFLPRGNGIITRRPLILQLIHSNTEYAEFSHLPTKKFTSFECVKEEIQNETNRIAGTNGGISNIPITLRVFSPQVLTLTLVDLPGLTKVPVGDQPPDIDIQIRNMILDYIRNENTLILAVSPANCDLANSDALLIAREVDVAGLRTIGVITKLDLMDEGTNAREVLLNITYPLKRGYIGLVNRSQKDIESNKNISDGLLQERKFFLQHPAYRDLADFMGTKYLQTVLHQQLTRHIKDSLPTLKRKIENEMSNMEGEINVIKMYSPHDPTSKSKMMMSMIHKFEREFGQCIEGSGNDIETNALSGGAIINRLFHERFSYELLKVGYDEHKVRNEIRFAILNVHGIRNGLFTPDMAFDIIVRDQIEKLKAPSLKLIDFVVEELLKIVHFVSEKVSHYPRLRNEVEQITCQRIKEDELKCKDKVNTLIDIQLSFMNTNHEDFITAEKKSTNQGNEKTDIPSRTDNIIIRKGWLTMHNTGRLRSGREYWFVLSSYQLVWYKDEQERDRRFTLPLGGLRLRDIPSTSIISVNPRHSFGLFDPESNGCIFKDYRELELSVDTEELLESWKASFLRAGVYPVIHQPPSNEPSELEAPVQSVDYHLERQVEIIKSLVDSYMVIITKTQKDLVPKIIMAMLVCKTQDYLKHEILASIYQSNLDINDLMSESPQTVLIREKKLQLYEAMNGSVRVISDILSADYDNNNNLPKSKSINNFMGYNNSPTAFTTTASNPHLTHHFHSLHRASMDNSSLGPVAMDTTNTYSPQLPLRQGRQRNSNSGSDIYYNADVNATGSFGSPPLPARRFGNVY